MATAPQQQALASLKDLLTSGDYSDLTITCGQDTYKVHKAIVCSKAGFFARAVRFGGKETESGVIDLPGDEPEITKLLVQYLYEAEYNPVLPTDSQVRTSTAAPPQEAGYKYDFPHSCQNGTSPSDWFDDTCTEKVCPHHTCADHQPWANYCCQNFTCELCKAEDFLLHAKMYETGDKYEVVGLKDLAKDKFKASCKHFWRNPSFALAVRHAFSTTVEDDTGLRDIVSATISEHLELVNDPEVGAILAEFNGSALGILRATFEKQEREKSGWK